MTRQESISILGVKEIGAKKLVGFRVVCDDIKEFGREIPKASMALASRKKEINNLVEPVNLIGAFKASETSQEEDGYWVCFEVIEYDDIPEDMVILTVPDQKYAVLDFTGHASEIFGTYEHLHHWISENGYTRVPSNWTLEIYEKWSENKDQVALCDPII